MNSFADLPINDDPNQKHRSLQLDDWWLGDNKKAPTSFSDS